MKKIFLFLFILISGLCYGQNKGSNTEQNTIIQVKRDNVNEEIKHGSLAFLNGCTMKTDINVNGSETSAGVDLDYIFHAARSKTNKRIRLYDIKKVNPNGTIKAFSPVVIAFE